MSADVVQVEHRGSVAIVTLNRPDNMNAVNQALRLGLISALRAANADDNIRAIVIAGAGGKAFSAGQDLNESANMQWQDLVSWLHAQRNMYQAVRDLDKPCIAAINGVAAGAG